MTKDARKRERGVYHAWRHMVARCHSPSDPTYQYYGARGIQVCDQWRHSFATFARDMGPRPSPRHSLERVDNEGPYSPENCRWATRSEQMRNTRQNRLVTAFCETKSVIEWVEDARCQVREGTLRSRLAARIEPEWAIATPPSRERGRKVAPKQPELA